MDTIKTVKENRFRCHSCEEKSKGTVQEKEFRKSSRIVRNAEVMQKTLRSMSVNQNSSINDEVDFLGFSDSEVNNLTGIQSSYNTATENQARNSVKRTRSRSPLSPRIKRARTQSPPRQRRSSLSENANSIDNDTNNTNIFTWSTNEVFDYFKLKFPRQAHVFEAEEIDGPSLYLLERDDVVKGFKIKIGPAVKIYDHIFKLKLKNNINN